EDQSLRRERPRHGGGGGPFVIHREQVCRSRSAPPEKGRRVARTVRARHGFDGVMTSEHHGGFPGYLPNPLQTAGFALDAMATGWAAPCPLLLPLRPTALVIEEIAWLAARHPGRVGLGVAAGALPADFEIMDTTMDDLPARFAAALAEVARVMSGGDAGALAN